MFEQRTLSVELRQLLFCSPVYVPVVHSLFFSERTANFEQLAVIYDITICCYSNHSFALVHNKCSITSVEIRLNFVLYMLHLATEGLVMMFLCCTY